MAKETDDLKSDIQAPKCIDQQVVLHIMYLYILEILEQRLPKACIAFSSSRLLMYPRAISSLIFCSKPIDSMVNQYCHAMETDEKGRSQSSSLKHT
jgi:hypothetical protein